MSHLSRLHTRIWAICSNNMFYCHGKGARVSIVVLSTILYTILGFLSCAEAQDQRQYFTKSRTMSRLHHFAFTSLSHNVKNIQDHRQVVIAVTVFTVFLNFTLFF